MPSPTTSFGCPSWWGPWRSHARNLSRQCNNLAEPVPKPCPVSQLTSKTGIPGNNSIKFPRMVEFFRNLLDYSTRHALAHWHALGCSYQGVLVIQRGDLSAGLQLLRAAFDEPGAAGSVPRLFTFLLAEAFGRAGQIADGLAVIEEAIVRSEHSEERWVFAELLRIKGELLLLQDAPGAAAAAEDHFRQALDWARRQGALSWELRTASSLARLWRDYHRVEEARVLGSVYGRFTEGFATADLRDAKSLLQELV